VQSTLYIVQKVIPLLYWISYLHYPRW